VAGFGRPVGNAPVSRLPRKRAGGRAEPEREGRGDRRKWMSEEPAASPPVCHSFEALVSGSFLGRKLGLAVELCWGLRRQYQSSDRQGLCWETPCGSSSFLKKHLPSPSLSLTSSQACSLGPEELPVCFLLRSSMSNLAKGNKLTLRNSCVDP